jgi:hypothetical protein
MQHHTLKVYEQGYFDGLRQAHADLLPGSQSCTPERKGTTRANTQFHPVYYEGFNEGLKDGAEVLLALGQSTAQG